MTDVLYFIYIRPYSFFNGFSVVFRSSYSFLISLSKLMNVCGRSHVVKSFEHVQNFLKMPTFVYIRFTQVPRLFSGCCGRFTNARYMLKISSFLVSHLFIK